MIEMIGITWRKDGCPASDVDVYIKPETISLLYRDKDYTVVELVNGRVFDQIIETPETILRRIGGMR